MPITSQITISAPKLGALHEAVSAFVSDLAQNSPESLRGSEVDVLVGIARTALKSCLASRKDDNPTDSVELVSTTGDGPSPLVQLFDKFVEVSSTVATARIFETTTLKTSKKVQLIQEVLREFFVRLNADIKSELESVCGLPNAAALHAYYAERYSNPESYSGLQLYIKFDLDNFKMINDAVGHETADVALRAMGKAIQSVFNRDNQFKSRPGGDEFTVIIPNFRGDAAGAQTILQRLYANLAQEFTGILAGNSIYIETCRLALADPEKCTKIRESLKLDTNAELSERDLIPTISAGALLADRMPTSIETAGNLAQRALSTVKGKGKGAIGFTVLT
jgi:diguanylate cyclase (GGDEF)-like protein